MAERGTSADTALGGQCGTGFQPVSVRKDRLEACPTLARPQSHPKAAWRLRFPPHSKASLAFPGVPFSRLRRPQSDWLCELKLGTTLPPHPCRGIPVRKGGSGRRDSNSRHSRWQRDALPTELRPRFRERESRGGVRGGARVFFHGGKMRAMRGRFSLRHPALPYQSTLSFRGEVSAWAKAAGNVGYASSLSGMEPTQTIIAWVVSDGVHGLRAGDARGFCRPMLQPGQAGSLSHIAVTAPPGFIRIRPLFSVPLTALHF